MVVIPTTKLGLDGMTYECLGSPSHVIPVNRSIVRHGLAVLLQAAAAGSAAPAVRSRQSGNCNVCYTTQDTELRSAGRARS